MFYFGEFSNTKKFFSLNFAFFWKWRPITQNGSEEREREKNEHTGYESNHHGICYRDGTSRQLYHYNHRCYRVSYSKQPNQTGRIFDKRDWKQVCKKFSIFKSHFQWNSLDKHAAKAYSERLILDDLKSHIVETLSYCVILKTRVYSYNPHCPVKRAEYNVEFMLILKLAS